MGSSIEFGISCNDAFNSFPNNYELLSTSTDVKEEDYTIKYSVDSDWGNGFTSTISITNNTENALEDWVLEFNFDREITSIWNAVIESHEENHYVIRNAGYNSTIVSKESVLIGFIGCGGDIKDEPKNYVLHTYNAFDENHNVEVDLNLDTDGDGIPDYIEEFLGTDKDKIDTDGDGLSDYYEFSVCNTSPINKDTDGDGITDDLDDEDTDGLSNILEYTYNTNPLVYDTDQDGLNDYQEIMEYGTDPLKSDTDEDGLTDYDDVKLNFSPLMKDTDQNGILDPDEIVEQTYVQNIIDEKNDTVTSVSVTMSVNGNIDNSLSICNMNNIDYMSSNVIGLIGVPVEINCSTEFEDAELTFWYDKNKLGDTNENDLAIMWYNEDDNCYTVLDDSVVDAQQGKVSYRTTHFSTYMLVDKTKWYSSWKETLDYRTKSTNDDMYYDFAFVIDVSGSMSGTRLSVAKEALNGFINVLDNKDSACLIKFNSYATVISGFTNDKDSLSAAIKSLYASGGTNVNSGLLKAINQKENKENSCNKKAIILLCDGDVNYNSSTIETCVANDIAIYTVNVGASSSSNYLKMMSEKTGGEYYFCPTAGSIETVFGEIKDDTIYEVDPTDTDNDGLFDVYETVGIRLINGQIIHTDPNMADTDGDGLTDYEEIGIVYTDKLNIGSLYSFDVKYVLMSSNPLMVDTDSDGKADPNDEKPWTYDTVNNLLIYQSAKPKGLTADGDIAPDLVYGDSTRQSLLSINDLFKYQLEEVDSPDCGPNTLFSEFKHMSTSFFSTGDMENVILDMIDHFKEGTGTEYTNDTLTEEAFKHKSTQKYIEDIKSQVIFRLKNNKGNIYDLEYNEENNASGQSIYNWVQKNCNRPIFHETSDITGGLTICVNDTWGNTVEVTDYTFDGEHFSGNLHFCIYDNFELDKPDVEKTYVELAGFRAWYVLQHYDQLGGAYVPYISIMEFDVPFEGNIISFKSAQ